MDVMGRGTVAAGGALGTLGAPSPDRVRSPWTWSPGGSVAGRGTGADPGRVGDEEADRLVASVIDRGDVPRVNRELAQWTRNGQPLPSGLPADVREWMERARRMPSWADRGRLDRAADFGERRSLYLNLLHGVGGGLLSAAVPREARAVHRADGEDRVTRTSLLGFAIGDPNAYRPDGRAVVETVRTRLAHAAVRHLLARSPDRARTGGGRAVPVSQADLLVTWHILSTRTLRKLREWEVPVPAADAAAYLHLWQVSAHLLGVRDEYIPATWDEAGAQSRQVLDPVLAPTREGIELTGLLLGRLAEQTSPGGIDRPLCNALARYLAGDRIADWNRVPREPFWERAIATAWPKLVAFREKSIPLALVPPLAWTIDEAIGQYLLFYLTQGRGARLDIPDTCRPTDR